MRLRNKQTDQVIEVGCVDIFADICYTYTSLEKLNEEWEDYDETKK